MFSIYALRDPETMQIRYVGHAVKLRDRYSGHVGPANRSKGHPSAVWIRGLVERGKLPILDLLETAFDKKIAGDRERWWMELMGRRGPLLNVQRHCSWCPGRACRCPDRSHPLPPTMTPLPTLATAERTESRVTTPEIPDRSCAAPPLAARIREALS